MGGFWYSFPCRKLQSRIQMGGHQNPKIKIDNRATKPKTTQPHFHIRHTDWQKYKSTNIYILHITFFNTWTYYKKKSVHAVFLTKQMILICQFLALGGYSFFWLAQVAPRLLGLLWLIPLLSLIHI